MKRRNKFRKSKGLFYCLGKVDEKSMQRKEFEISLKRSVLERVRRGFIKTYRPVMDNAPYRIFSRMQDYKSWCEKKLPEWLGYGKTT